MSAVKRAIADANELNKTIYADSGIYYSMEESNVLNGYACVFGPPGTPYEDFPAFYSVTIGPTYPFDPPQVKFLSYDGKTRFHPNMYVCGKVCLSILHTWSGPKWASTMRLSTIFVTLQSILDSQPLKHEPGYGAANEEKIQSYSKFVEFKCISYILWLANTLIDQTYTLPNFIKPFETILISKMPTILERIYKRIENRNEEYFVSLPYSMEGHTCYAKMREEIVKLKERWNKNSK